MKRAALVFAVTVLFVVVAFQLFGRSSRNDSTVPPELATLVPRSLPGWVSEDKPVADSPEMLKNVERILNYDDAIYRIYKKGDLEVALYMAYWLPGRIHPSGIDAHTPDVCWVANGWSMRELQGFQGRSPAGRLVNVPNFREFTVDGQRLTVAYWHFVGRAVRQSDSVAERFLSVGERAARRFSQMWDAVFSEAEQQLFIRISINGDLREAGDLAPFQACLAFVQDVEDGVSLSEK